MSQHYYLTYLLLPVQLLLLAFLSFFITLLNLIYLLYYYSTISQQYYLTELFLPGQLLLLSFHSFLNPRLNLIYFPQRKAMAPQVNPPPNPTITILSPSLILPCFNDSDKAIGIEADELLP